MSIKKLIIILSACILTIGAYVDKNNIEYKHIQFVEYPLQITCPKCGYIFYYVTEKEIYGGEIAPARIFIPAQKWLPLDFEGKSFECPIDGTRPYITIESQESPTGIASNLHTNKGWMPKRMRPIQFD